jgi:predicted lipopolysaccharide heptosyltransferase III
MCVSENFTAARDSINGVNVVANRPFQNILLVRLRSIGDTALMTPALSALKAWNPNARITVVTEPLSAPVLEAHPLVDELIVTPRTGKGLKDALARAALIRRLRRRQFDAAFNMHGGTTAAWIMRLSGARRRVGYPLPNTKFLLTDPAPAPQEIWGKPDIHCVEQQLGLLKFVGVPVAEVPRTSLAVAPPARARVRERLHREGVASDYAVVHPAAAFATKRWEAERFAEILARLAARGLHPVVVTAAPERAVAEAVRRALAANVTAAFITDFSLAECMALIADCRLFVGNDSGPAHIAAGFARPLTVIFGSSNDVVWRPWTAAPHRVVRRRLPCVPCPGYVCHAFAEPECIKQVTVGEVEAAIDAVLREI